MTRYFLGLCWVTLYLCLIQKTACAQQQSLGYNHQLPLFQVLKVVSKQYNVNFLYEEKSITNKTLSFDIAQYKSEKLPELLNQILTPLNLTSYKVDNDNYSLFPIKKAGQAADLSGSKTSLGLTDSLANGKVTGRVLNELGHGQQFATVSIIRVVDSAVVSNALSDTSGIYSFSAIKRGLYIIQVTSIGYKTAYSRRFNLSAGASITPDPIVMDVFTKTLKTVQVTSSRPVVETRSDRFILNVENSAMANGNSIQLLRSAPFVQVSADNNISLQGKKTMILIDNKPVPDALLDNILQTLPAGNISRIELITHPSAKYDAAYGAVINITTKKSQIEGLTGNVRLEGSAGIYAQGNLNGVLTYKHKKLTIYATGGIERSDDFFAINSERILASTDKPDVLTNDWRRLMHNRTYSYDGGLDYKISENQNIGAVVNGGVYNLNGPWTTTNKFNKLGGPIDSTLFTNSAFTNKVTGGNYNINYHLSADSGKNDLTLLSTYTTFRRNLFQNFPSTLYGPDGDVIRTPPTYQTTNRSAINVYIAQADYTHIFKKQWQLETGAKYQNTGSKNTIDYADNSTGQFVNVPANSSDNMLDESIFSGYGIITKDWKLYKLQAGLRAENTAATFRGYFSQDYLNLFPTLLLQRTIDADDILSLTYKRTINRAPYSELVPYTVFINQYTIEQGNPSLKPEYGNIFSLNANIHKLNLSLSYTSIKGMIALLPVKQNYDTQVTYFSRQNLNTSSDLSFYLYYPITVTRWWEMQNSGTLAGYTRAEGTVLGAKYILSGFHGDFRSAQLFKVSRVFKVEADAYYWSSNPQDLTRNSGYKNMDVAMLLDIFNGRGQLRLSGNQILLKRNDYRLDRDFGFYQSHDVINTDSRRVGLGFTYKFGKTKISSPDKKLGNEDALKRLK